MNIDILCSSPEHPVNDWLRQWIEARADADSVRLLRSKAEASGGDILFLVSCTEIIGANIRNRYAHTFVLHAADLPAGRGWSPHIWAILAGADRITVSLLEAADKVDSGAIWAKRSFAVPADALYDEINALLFTTELELMSDALRLIAAGHRPQPQDEAAASHYPRRRPEDSEVSPDATIADCFNLLRVADPERYPAFFRLHGHRYRIRIEKMS